MIFLDGRVERQPIAYSMQGLSEAMGIGQTSIRMAIREGRLPARMLGTKPIILREDAEAYLKSLPATGERAA